MRDASGQTLTDRAVTWSTGNTSIATVSQGGLVTAMAPGTATITATSEGQSGSAVVTVISAVASVSITPQVSSLQVGGSARLSATARDASGGILPGKPVVWASSAPSIASVSGGQGDDVLVTAVSAGVVTVTATIEGRSATLLVTVTPAQVTLTGMVVDQDSIPLANATVEIRQNGGLLATLATNAQGLFTRTATLPGRYEIRARRFGHLEGQATYDLSGTSAAAIVRLVLDHRPVAGFVNPTVVESYTDGAHILHTDILVADENGELLPLAPEAFTVLPTASGRTFQRLSVTTETTPLIGTGATMVVVNQTTAMAREDTLGHRVRIARSLVGSVNGAGQLVALAGMAGTTSPIGAYRVFGNGFTPVGAAASPWTP